MSTESIVTIRDDEVEVGFIDALYRGKCGECGEGLGWEASFDADGTTYSAWCCEHLYRMTPSRVKVSRDAS
jgi:hypothetical protein